MGICRRPSGCVVGDGRFREKRQPGFRKKNAIQGKIRGAGSGNTKRWFREKNWRFRETRGTRFREISKAGFREKNRTFNEIQVSLTNTSYEREASLNHGGKARSADGPKSAARHGRRNPPDLVSRIRCPFFPRTRPPFFPESAVFFPRIRCPIFP